MEEPREQVHVSSVLKGLQDLLITVHLHAFNQTANLSGIRINGNELVEGQNTISLTITGETGISRILTLRVLRPAGEANTCSDEVLLHMYGKCYAVVLPFHFSIFCIKA